MADRWHILGAGAIGSLLAWHLHRAGRSVQLVYRDSKRLRERGSPLRLVLDERRESVPVETGLVNDSARISQLLLCTKANQALDALTSVRSRLTDDCPVVLLHNGMGVLEQLGEILHPTQVYCGITTEAAYWNSAGELVYAGRGHITLGQPGRHQPPDWFEKLSPALPRSSWEADIEHSLWRKLLVNCAINPLTAIHGVANGALPLAHSAQLEDVCTELAAVARALGYTALANGLREDVVQVCTATRSNRSSMLQDIRAGRASEIEFITGYLCLRARQLGVECPLNQGLLAQVRQLENQGA